MRLHYYLLHRVVTLRFHVNITHNWSFERGWNASWSWREEQKSYLQRGEREGKSENLIHSLLSSGESQISLRHLTNHAPERTKQANGGEVRMIREQASLVFNAYPNSSSIYFVPVLLEWHPSNNNRTETNEDRVAQHPVISLIFIHHQTQLTDWQATITNC